MPNFLLKYKNLFIAEGSKYFQEQKRYFFNFISGLLIIYIIFLAIFYGLKTFVGQSMDGDSLDSIVIGYLMWLFAIGGYQSLSSTISDEMQRGTLEQLYLCPLGIEASFIFKLFYDFFYGLFFNSIILVLTMLTTNRWLHINIGKTLLILILSIPSIWALGLMFGGMAIIYKKISVVFSVFTFLLIAVVAIPAEPFTRLSLLPFASGSTIMRLIVKSNYTFDVPISWYIYLIINSTSYLAIGIFVYKQCEKIARRKNLLGQY